MSDILLLVAVCRKKPPANRGDKLKHIGHLIINQRAD
jgi:hypothetical protein